MAARDLLRIVYVSLAARLMTAADLDAIEAASSRQNARAGLTGLLFAQGPFFYGILEGPPVRLMKRMEVIIADPRHRGVRILCEQEVGVRRFRGWRLFRLPWCRRADEAAQQPGLDFILDLARRVQ